MGGGGGGGASVGAAVGGGVGRGVGRGVGAGVGADVGRGVGAAVGRTVGAWVGAAGAAVGGVVPGVVATGVVPPGDPGVVGRVGAAAPVPGDALADGLAPPDCAGDSWPTAVSGVADAIGTATNCGAPDPDEGGTMADNALARMMAMTRPKAMPTAV